VFDLARPPVPDVLILLDEEPARAMERRRASGDELEPWENEAFLGALREGYRAAADLLRKNRADVLVFDPAAEGVEAIAAAAEHACRRRAFVDPGVAAQS
jgi:thymidylate kinase